MSSEIFERLYDAVLSEKENRSSAVACVKEIHKRELWKSLGFKSTADFCRKNLLYEESETRDVLGAAGIIVAREQMVDPDPQVQSRIDALRAWRKEKARQLVMPHYFILYNRTILAIARQNPKTIEELNQISGIGSQKSQDFGTEILNCIM
ncbi:MAG: HRDC domain-containing protein [Pseudobdellovibrionaceae bacterium]